MPKKVVKCWWWWWRLPNWGGQDQQGRSRAGAKQKWGWSMSRAGLSWRFTIGRLWWVSWVGQKIAIDLSNSRRPFKYILCWYLPNVAPHNKFHQNQMKKTKVESIQYWSTLVGQLGWSKNSRSHFKNILCCSFPNVTPHNKFHLNRMKNTEVQIFDILEK